MSQASPLTSPSSLAKDQDSYKELDLNFLQTRCRDWLEGVLGESFKEKSLQELLADGEVLVDAARALRQMVKTTPDSPSLSRPGSLRKAPSKKLSYLAYNNIDAFLQVCRDLGLTDVDLFSPPDLVEARDLRRVCLCIRTLSKKLQHMDLHALGTIKPKQVAAACDFDGAAGPTLARSFSKARVEDTKGRLQANGSPPPRPLDPVSDTSESPLGPKHSRRLSFGSSAPSMVAGPPAPKRSSLGPGVDAAKANGSKRERSGLWWALGAALIGVAGGLAYMLLQEKKEYKVKEGDTLVGVSKRLGKSHWEELLKLNPDMMDRPDLIYPEEKIVLK